MERSREITLVLKMYESSIQNFKMILLENLFGLKRDEVTRGWRKLHHEELHSLYSSPNIISAIISRWMR
jgi:hypothetical protein